MRVNGRKKGREGQKGRRVGEREGGREECFAGLEILTKQLFALGLS